MTHSRITKAYWRIRWGATCVVCRMPSWINPPKYHEDWVGHEWKRWGHADWCPEPGGHDLDCLGHLATRHHQEIVLGPNVEYWKLHSVALSPEEIALRYKAQVMADNPVAYWHMGNKGGPDT